MNYYVIDANVMLTAGKRLADIPDELLECWRGCIDFIRNIIHEKAKIVVDDAWEVLKEYDNTRTIIGYPNASGNFYQYVMTNQMQHLSFIHLNKTGEYEYEKYPDDQNLKSFDRSDKKYIALAYNHDNKPPIIEATDSKWWGIKKNLEAQGIGLQFVDEKYIMQKYQQKME